MGGGGGVPARLYLRAAELGFLGLKYPIELGGQGGDCVHDAVWAEELAAAGASGGVGAGLGAHTGIATPPVHRFGTPDQHERFLRPAIRGERIAALGITEPGAGSDVASIRTIARRVDGGYVVNGSKTFITNGVRADFLVCAVKTTEGGGHQGLSFLILEREMPGYEVVGKLEKMGWRSSDTAELSFTDVEVPAENLLGEENRGFYMIMENFAWERLLMSLGAVGAMRRLLGVAIQYAGEREAFGRPIGRFQAIRHKIAEIGVKAEVGRALTYHALRRLRGGRGCDRRCDQGEALHPARLRRGRGRGACRSSAATATCASTESSERFATPGSGRSAAAPTRSCARSSGAGSASESLTRNSSTRRGPAAHVSAHRLRVFRNRRRAGVGSRGWNCAAQGRAQHRRARPLARARARARSRLPRSHGPEALRTARRAGPRTVRRTSAASGTCACRTASRASTTRSALLPCAW